MKAKTILFMAMAALVLFFVGTVVFAQDDRLKALLQGKVAEYQGTCRIDATGLLTFDDTKTVGVQLCSVGGIPNDDTTKWILLFSEGGVPMKLIRLDKEGMKQTVLWVNLKFQV